MQSIEAEVFASLPGEFRKPRRAAWSDVNAAGRALDSFLESPSFDREGNLYVTDIPHGRVFRIDPQARWSLVTEYDGWPNGLKHHQDGRLFVADHARGILTLDPQTGRTAVVAGDWRNERFKGVNDLHFAANGDLYFTDQGQTGLHDPTGRVFRLPASGGLDCLLGTVPSPNGLCLNLEGNQLYVAATRANAVWRLPLMANGSVSKVGLYLQLSGGAAGPDGLALDREGGLVVAHPGTGAWRFDAQGRPTHRIACAGEPFITNVAFGGEGLRFLYLTESHRGLVLRAELPVPGQALYSHSNLPTPRRPS